MDSVKRLKIPLLQTKLLKGFRISWDITMVINSSDALNSKQIGGEQMTVSINKDADKSGDSKSFEPEHELK